LGTQARTPALSEQKQKKRQEQRRESQQDIERRQGSNPFVLAFRFDHL
jgi:hypothetical protein